MQDVSVSKTRSLVTSALFAALIAVSAFITVPFGDVPFTLQTAFVFLAALVLPPSAATAAVGTYVLAGAVGLPVFAGGKAGLAVVAGPTGGFLLGFIVGAWFGSALRSSMAEKTTPVVADAACVATVLALTYAMGWAQLALVTGMGPVQVFTAGVLPFIGVDAVKGIGAIAVARTLRRARVV